MRTKLEEITSVVTMVSGFIVAIATLIPAFNEVIVFPTIIFIFSVHVRPWLGGSRAWVRFLSVLGVIGYLLTIFINSLGALIWLPVLMTIVVLLAEMTGGKRRSKREKPKEPRRQVPKPATQQGGVLTVAFLLGSQLLTLVNPLQLGQMLVQVVGLAVVGIRVRGALPQLDGYEQQTTFRLPVQGTWYVANGGVNKDNSHSWDVLNQRYAYDLVMLDDEMYSHRGNGKVKNDYYCYGQLIVAPAAGEVVQINDGVREAMYPGRMILDFLARDFRGNFVIIKHSEQEYSFLAHFVPKSIAVKVGDTVEQGQFIGKCGNSGHSTEPHLHFHVQDRPSFFFSAGLPIQFSEVAVDGTHHKQAYLAKGQSVMRSVEKRTGSMRP